MYTKDLAVSILRVEFLEEKLASEPAVTCKLSRLGELNNIRPRNLVLLHRVGLHKLN